MLYRFLLRPILYLLPAETAHHLAFFWLRVVTAVPGMTTLLRALMHRKDEALAVDVLGQRFPNPVGLAAGFDKEAKGFEALGALGFGYVEVGTVTGQGQAGNTKPRLFRLVPDRALINRMGFNNEGSAVAQERLDRPHKTVVGVNIGKTKIVPEDEAAQDYVLSTQRLAPLADYFVVNVSSPNTPGLRNLQAVEKLRPLLAAVRQAVDEAVPSRALPLLVKIAPDLADDDVDAVADLALELGLDGIVATNTTISREGLITDAAKVESCGAGGLSGAPVHDRSLEVLVRLRQRVGDRVALVSVGGIETASQAYARIRAGASLVQVYTGFVYHGPTLPRRLALGMLELAKADGFASIQDAIGADESR